MHGGMKTFRDSPADARHYVEADLARTDDYYLAEDTGIAERYAASPEAGVRQLEPLTGDGYEAWVAGVDPVTGQPKGRPRNDASQVKSMAWHEWRETERHYSMALQHYGTLGTVDDPHVHLAQVERAITIDTAELARARSQIAELRAEPTLRAQPADVVDVARTAWQVDREQRASWQAARAVAEREGRREVAPRSAGVGTMPEILHDEPGHGISR